MNVILAQDYRDMSARAARIIACELTERPDALLALSTGSTPVGTYDELVRLHDEEGLDFSCCRILNMDEYLGLGDDHPQGYRYFMRKHLYDRVGLPAEHAFGPDALAADPAQAGKEFDERIRREGGIDLILLGIGRDGHIAFNMPADELALPTHAQRLSDATIADNARFFDSVDEVPTQALTIGLEQIFASRKVVMVANGEAKADAMDWLLRGATVDTHLPASLLRLHPDFTVVVDRAAAPWL